MTDWYTQTEWDARDYEAAHALEPEPEMTRAEVAREAADWEDYR